jgi:hypothetical protein
VIKGFGSSESNDKGRTLDPGSDRLAIGGDQGEIPGRTLSITAGLIAILVATVSFLIWIKDIARIPPCTNGAVQFFDLSLTGRWVTGCVGAGAALTVAVSSTRRPHRLAAGVAIFLALLSFGVAAAAVDVHGGHVSDCWNF